MRQSISILIAFLLTKLNAQEIFYQSNKAFECNINFDLDSWKINEDQLLFLDTLKTIIANQDSIRIELNAHTDHDGSNEYNLRLSQKRAAEVKAYLNQIGVNNNIIRINAEGENAPIATNSTDHGKAKNRRVELTVFSYKKLQWINGIVKNDSSETVPNALVKLHSKTHTDSSYTDLEGKFKLSAPIKEVIGLDIVAKDHMPIMNQMMRLTPKVVSKPIELKMETIDVGKKFEVHRLNFVGDKAILVQKSIPILPFLKEFMTMNQGTCIHIIGHINHPNAPVVAKDSRNHELSIARAKTINDYLLDKAKVDQSRMMYEGRGNSEMLFPKANNEKEMAQNRRVIIMIADCNVTKTAVSDTLSGLYDFWF